MVVVVTPTKVTFRLAPLAIGTVWAGVALGVVVLLYPHLGGPADPDAVWTSLLLSGVFGSAALLMHRYRLVYDPHGAKLHATVLATRTIDLTGPLRLRASGAGFYLHPPAGRKVGVALMMQSNEGLTALDLLADIAARAPQLEAEPELREGLLEHARDAQPLQQRVGWSPATRMIVQVVAVAAVAGIVRTLLRA